MTPTSAASTHGDSWNRLPRGKDALEPRPWLPQAFPAGVKTAPPSLAALELPRGKVLMVIDDAILALDLQRLLHEAGYRVVGPATTVAEIQRLVQRGDIDCAMLDLDMDRRVPLPIADLLAFADVPFVYLTTGILDTVPERHRRAPAVAKPFTRDMVLDAIERAKASRERIANDNRWRPDSLVRPSARVYPPL